MKNESEKIKNRYNRVATFYDFMEKNIEFMSLAKWRREIMNEFEGEIIMIEHVRSEKKLLGLLMDIMNPLVLNIVGANINRRTVENIKKSGYSNVTVAEKSGDIVKKIVIQNEK